MASHSHRGQVVLESGWVDRTIHQDSPCKCSQNRDMGLAGYDSKNNRKLAQVRKLDKVRI